jgi:hypothetical protein
MKRPITERQISFVTNVARTARLEFSSKQVFMLAMETAWDLQQQELDKAVDLACQAFVEDPKSRYCLECGYPRGEHRG